MSEHATFLASVVAGFALVAFPVAAGTVHNTVYGKGYVYDINLPAVVKTYTEGEKEAQRAAGRKMLADLKSAVDSGAPSFTVAPGVYRLQGYRALRFSGVKDFKFIAKDVELICDDIITMGSYFFIDSCENLEIVGPIRIDADPLPYSQAVVLDYDAATGRADLQVMKGYAVPKEGDPDVVYYVFTPDGRFIPQVYQTLGDYQVKDAKRRVVSAKILRGDPKNMQRGNLVSIGVRGGGCCIIKSKNVTLRDVDAYTGNMAGWGPGNNGVSYINFRGIRRPGTNRLLGACGPQMSSPGGIVRFEGCVFENCNDDALNFQGGHMNFLAYRQIDPRTWITFGGEMDKGSEIEIYDPATFRVRARGKVKSAEVFEDAAMRVDATNMIAGAKRLQVKDLGKLRRVEFESDLRIECGDVCANRSERAEKIVIRNCYFYGSGNNVAMQSFKNVLFEDNVVESVNSGVSFMASVWWWEGAGTENVVIRNNTFINTSTAMHKGKGAVFCGFETKCPSTGSAVRVLIEGNTFRSPNNYGVLAQNARKVVIRNNEFFDVKNSVFRLDHVKDALITGNHMDNVTVPPFEFSDVENVKVVDNVFSNLGIDRGKLSVLSDARNVHIDGNEASEGKLENHLGSRKRSNTSR